MKSIYGKLAEVEELEGEASEEFEKTFGHVAAIMVNVFIESEIKAGTNYDADWETKYLVKSLKDEYYKRLEKIKNRYAKAPSPKI